MPSLEIKQLYNQNRLPNDPVKIIHMLLYLPFGLLLLLSRTIFFLTIFLFSLIVPKTKIIHNVLLKLYCYAIGISINVENIDRKENVEAFISNSISIFDSVVLHYITGCVTPSFDLNTLQSIFGERYFGSITNIDTLKKNLAAFMDYSKLPLHFQPESAITNGKAVLKFINWPFSLCSKVQPIVICTKRPIFDISISTLNSSYWTDVFFFLFSPYTVFNIKFLPQTEKKSLSEIEFAKTIQQNIASTLKIEASEYNGTDLKDWARRYKLEQERAQNIQNRPVMMTNIMPPELQRMGLQVKEVLPMVPLNVIFRDLAKTRNVDITITNILEGTVRYIPENIPVPTPSSTKSSVPINISSSSSSSYTNQNVSKDPFNTAASSFGKSPTERSLSFHERKQLLIENARKKYIEKHALNLVALNNC